MVRRWNILTPVFRVGVTDCTRSATVGRVVNNNLVVCVRVHNMVGLNERRIRCQRLGGKRVNDSQWTLAKVKPGFYVVLRRRNDGG